MGVDPAYASSVAGMISHNPFAKQPHAGWSSGSAPPDPDAALPGPKAKGKAASLVKVETGDTDDIAQPKKKARAPKPPATGQQYNPRA